MNKIYEEKILPFPENGLSKVGIEEATKLAIAGKGMLYANLGYFYRLEEFPCKIINVKPLK